MSAGTNLRIALASKGGYEEATSAFLSTAGLGYWRPNPRQYVGRLNAIPDAEILFQRPEDIVHKVADGSADLGITGLDLVSEHAETGTDVHIVLPDLGFRRCQLVVAVPDSWLDVTTIDDLAELSIDLKRSGRQLRVATKFPNLVSDHFYRNGINYFMITGAHGALEVAPVLGYADVIADLTETGVTLRDNHLRPIEGGVVLRAQACLIANAATIAQTPARLEQARSFIELCEAKLHAQEYRVITANVPGVSADAIAAQIIAELEFAGESGPTIAPVFAKHGDGQGWYAVSVIVPANRLLAAVDHLRTSGSRGIAVTRPDYMFDTRSRAFDLLLKAVQGDAGKAKSRRPW